MQSNGLSQEVRESPEDRILHPLMYCVSLAMLAVLTGLDPAVLTGLDPSSLSLRYNQTSLFGEKELTKGK